MEEKRKQEELARQEAEAVEEEEIPQLPTAEEIEEIQNDAFAEGLAQGHERGYEDGKKLAEDEAKEVLDAKLAELEQQQQELQQEKAQLQQQLQQQVRDFSDMLEFLSQPLQELDDVVEEQMVELSTAIARQLIRRELKTHPDEIIAVVRDAIALLPVSSRKIDVYLNPEDLPLVKETLHPDPEAEEESRIHLHEDASLTRGGCRVVSNDSHIDASVERRINAVITQVLGGERDEDSDAE
jgi:flagellar assembly protein FliH